MCLISWFFLYLGVSNKMGKWLYAKKLHIRRWILINWNGRVKFVNIRVYSPIQNLRRAFISTNYYSNVACCYPHGFLKPNQFEKSDGVTLKISFPLNFAVTEFISNWILLNTLNNICSLDDLKKREQNNWIKKSLLNLNWTIKSLVFSVSRLLAQL